MKKNMKSDGSTQPSRINTEKITRKEAFKKAGKYAALTAGTLIFLDTKASAAGSAPQNPGSGW